MDQDDTSLCSWRKSDSALDAVRNMTVRRSSLPLCQHVSKLRNQQHRRSLDRYIPRRQGSDLESASFLLSSPDTTQNESVFFNSLEVAAGTPGRNAGIRRGLSRDSATSDARILAFSPRNVQTPPDLIDLKRKFNDLEVSTPRGSPKRTLPHSPERVLDMPQVKDDFYGNIMDWSSRDCIALAMGNEVHCWTAANSTNSIVYRGQQEDGTAVEIRSVAWCPRGKNLALGTVQGDVRVYNGELKEVTVHHDPHSDGLCGHEGETDAVAWDRTGKEIFSCHKCSCVHTIVPKTNTIITLELKAPRGSCGLQVSPDNKYLIVGSNAGIIQIWGIRENKVVQKINAHLTATKALSWIPWQQSVFLSGGGSGDGFVRMWNAKKGEKMGEVNTNSQVCCMVVSSEYHELITGHGHQCTDIIVWRLPSLIPVGRLVYHESRVLQLALSPDEETLASLGGDESLMFWKCFEGLAKLQTRRVSSPLPCSSPLLSGIR